MYVEEPGYISLCSAAHLIQIETERIQTLANRTYINRCNMTPENETGYTSVSLSGVKTDVFGRMANLHDGKDEPMLQKLCLCAVVIRNNTKLNMDLKHLFLISCWPIHGRNLTHYSQ